MVDYALKPGSASAQGQTLGSAWRALKPLLAGEKKNVTIAVACVIFTTISQLLSPILNGRILDTAIPMKDYHQVLLYAGGLAVIYVLSLRTSYVQTVSMGRVGRNTVFKLRNGLFGQLSRLPIAFFAQNRAGDLISRVNGDTEQINNFFSQALMQMFGNLFLCVGTGVLLLALNWKMGLTAMVPAAGMLIVTRLLSPWVKRTSRSSMDSLGALSADITESLANFQVILAFNRRDYFRQKFGAANISNYKASVTAGISSGLFQPLYTLAASAAQILVLALGVFLISRHELTVGLLVAYLLYVSSFYNPLRQLATVWSSWQTMLAAMDRVSDVLNLPNNLVQEPEAPAGAEGHLLAFDGVDFAYPGGKPVLANVSLTLERGRTYALVGPTGGGKTTTAMLMARLYDPSAGKVYLDGQDIRSLDAGDKTRRIGFILQDPFLLAGTIRDNIVYGNADLADLDDAALTELMASQGLTGFLARFGELGLATPVKGTGDGLSLGQRQLVAFLRAVLRRPEILILDEATANIDTVTEQMLEEVLAKLPEATTKVIIAHRLNTIQNADEIFFVGGGAVTPAGSMEHAMGMLLSHDRVS